MTFWCGSGSGDPCLWLTDPDPAIFVIDPQDANKKKIKKKFFCLLLFEGTFTLFFKDKKSQRSHKTVGIKVFLTIFAWCYKDPDPDPYLWLIDPDPYLWLIDPDPDPGGPKTYGAEFGSAGVNSFSFSLSLNWARPTFSFSGISRLLPGTRPSYWCFRLVSSNSPACKTIDRLTPNKRNY